MAKYRSHVEIEVEIDYDYQPAEKQTLEYPGCDEEVIINSVIITSGPLKTDLMPYLHGIDIESFQENILQQIREHREEA